MLVKTLDEARKPEVESPAVPVTSDLSVATRGSILTIARNNRGRLFSFAIVVLCVLGFCYQPTRAAQPGKQPFRNPVTQREEMIRELKSLRLLVKEQNQLLRAIQQQNAKSKPR